jgi:hypothetical protein
MNTVSKSISVPAELKKSASIAGQRNAGAKFPSPYTLKQDTLFECLREFMSKPISQRHLCEIHTLRRRRPKLYHLKAIELARLGVRDRK